MVNTVKWAFSVGHVFNDLCASLWFIFTMPYFTKVIRMGNAFAGDIILIGQVADAIATPLIGIESDRVGFLCHRYIGQRKSWYLFGTITCAISFPFIFNSFFDLNYVEEWYLVVYYAPFVVLFQISWAIVQITHLSLIPFLMTMGQDNSSLNSLRYMWTVAANIIVLSTTTALFNLDNQGDGINATSNAANIAPSSISLNPNDKNTFRWLTIGVIGLGLFFSLLFLFGVGKDEKKEIIVTESTGYSENETSLLLSNRKDMQICDWFKEPKFYLINFLYLSTRLIVNVSQVYLILYVVDSLGLSKIQSSLGALTTFISGAISSFILKKLQNKIGKKICYLMGLIFVMSFCVVVSFSHFQSPPWKMYLSMILLGIGCSMIMIGSLSLTAELIGQSCSSSAFVYGSMSFSDKMVCGIVIWFMQRLGPKTSDCASCNRFYKFIELYFIGGCTVAAFIILLIMYPMNIGLRWKDRKSLKINDINSCEAENS